MCFFYTHFMDLFTGLLIEFAGTVKFIYAENVRFIKAEFVVIVKTNLIRLF